MPSKRQTSSSQSGSLRASASASSAASKAGGGGSISLPTNTTTNTEGGGDGGPVTGNSNNRATTTSTKSATNTGPANNSNASKPQSKPSSSSSVIAAQKSSSSTSSTLSPQEIFSALWENYVSKTPQRVKLIDAFMGFLILVGGLQFVYCVLVGNYPFNAFLSGFSATVGQFVLTASLRIQTNPANKSEFSSISPERAFADFVLGSLILHFFCVNFIN